MIAGLSPSAASAHLARLTDGGLLALEVRGRHRYFRIASADIAASIEALANVAQVERAASAPRRVRAHGADRHALARAPATTTWRANCRWRVLRAARRPRTAGACKGRRSEATSDGAARFADWGIDVSAQRSPSTPLRLHMPGLERATPAPRRRAGAALLDSWAARGWSNGPSSRAFADHAGRSSAFRRVSRGVSGGRRNASVDSGAARRSVRVAAPTRSRAAHHA